MAGWLSKPSEHERVEALLSPYLDGRVTPSERALVERHLQACSECSRGLATLRVTVTAVREMPRVRAPRSFALPRSMARQPQTNPWLVPVLRAATAVATFLLVITVAGDLFMRGMGVPTAAPVMFAPVAQKSGARSVVSATSQAEAREMSATPIEPPVEDALGRDGRGGGPEPALGGGGAVPPSGAGAVAPPAPLASPAPTQPAAALTSVQVTPTTKNADAASFVPTLTVGTQPMPAPLAAASAPAASTPAAKLSAPQAPTASPTAAALAQPPAPKRTASEPTSAIAPAQPTEAAYAAPAPVAPAPSADQAQTESQAASQSTAWRIAEGLLAVLAIAFGVTAWIVHRRSR